MQIVTECSGGVITGQEAFGSGDAADVEFIVIDYDEADGPGLAGLVVQAKRIEEESTRKRILHEIIEAIGE